MQTKFVFVNFGVRMWKIRQVELMFEQHCELEYQDGRHSVWWIGLAYQLAMRTENHIELKIIDLWIISNPVILGIAGGRPW